jgi:hypothetical protein
VAGKLSSRGTAERGAASKHQTTAADYFAVLEPSYDWLPHFDDAEVVCRFHGIAILRSED